MADPTSITNAPGDAPPAAPPSGFVPYIADRLRLPEFTLQAVLVGMGKLLPTKSEEKGSPR